MKKITLCLLLSSYAWIGSAQNPQDSLGCRIYSNLSDYWHIDTICLGDTLTFYWIPGLELEGTIDLNYRWTDAPDIVTILGPKYEDTVRVIFDKQTGHIPFGGQIWSGTDTLWGCSLGKSVYVLDCPPEAGIGAGTKLCEGSCMSYQNTSGHLPTAWQWQFTGGEPSTYTGRVPPEICYPAAGIYTTTLIVSNLSGVDTATHTLQVYAAPQGQNTAVSLDFKTGDLLDLKACEEGQHYLWEPDIGLACDTCQTTGFNPILVQPTYTCLVYDDLPACGLKCTYSITLENGSIYIPTGFSPNNDGYNDYFTAYGGNLSAKQIKRMQVFDRWGNVLFTTQNIPFNNSSQGWDGSAKGLPLDVGVYVYLIEIEQWDGTSKLFSGDISLIK